MTNARSEKPVVLRVADELVVESAESGEQLRELLRAGRHRIVLDMRHTTYISGIGLGLVADGAKQARRGGGDVKLVVSRPEVRRLFDLGELGSMLEFYDDVESACGAFGESVGRVERTMLLRQFDDD